MPPKRRGGEDDTGGPDAGGNSQSINAIVGMDNVTAVATPEPASMLLLAIGGIVAIRRRAP